VQGQPAKQSSKKLTRSNVKPSINDDEGDNDLNPTLEVCVLPNGGSDGNGEHDKGTWRFGGTIPTCSSPLRQSVVRSSLREIPADEVRHSGVSKLRIILWYMHTPVFDTLVHVYSSI